MARVFAGVNEGWGCGAGPGSIADAKRRKFGQQGRDSIGPGRLDLRRTLPRQPLRLPGADLGEGFADSVRKPGNLPLAFPISRPLLRRRPRRGLWQGWFLRSWLPLLLVVSQCFRCTLGA